MTDNHRDEQMPDDVIMIYADGGLTPDQREVVSEALSRDPEALKDTISRSHPLFTTGIESFPAQRPCRWPW